LPVPEDESAVPSELVPGVAALLPKAPPVTELWCEPMPPPRASAGIVARAAHSPTQRMKTFFMPTLPCEYAVNGTLGWLNA
jgi:hypothetical protein